MIAQQAAAVLRKVTAYQPGQRMDEYTPQAWAEALAPYEYDDAMDAVTELATAPRRQGEPWTLEVRDIISEINRMRNRRYEQRRAQIPPPPSGLSPEAYLEWLRTTTAAASMREWTAPPAIEYPARPVRRLIAGLSARTQP